MTRNNTLAVLLLIALCAAGGGVFFLLRWHADTQAAARYHAASACAGGATSDCLRYGRVTVVKAQVESSYSSSSNASTYTYYVSVRLPDGRVAEQQATSDSHLYDSLSAGMPMIAEHWNGKMVSLVASDGSRMGLKDQPAWQAGEMLAGAWMLVSLALLVGLVLLLATHPSWFPSNRVAKGAYGFALLVWIATLIPVLRTGTGAGNAGPSGRVDTAALGLRAVAVPTPAHAAPTPASNGPTAMRPTATTPAIAQAAAWHSDRATGMAVALSRPATDRGSGFDVPSRGPIWFWLYVTVDNRGRAKYFYNPLDFHARDERQRQYTEGVFELSGQHRELGNGKLPPRAVTSGWVGFEISTAARSLTILWDDGNALASPMEVGTYPVRP
jgi:Domain of unknown function (DUF4352)